MCDFVNPKLENLILGQRVLIERPVFVTVIGIEVNNVKVEIDGCVGYFPPSLLWVYECPKSLNQNDLEYD